MFTAFFATVECVFCIELQWRPSLILYCNNEINDEKWNLHESGICMKAESACFYMDPCRTLYWKAESAQTVESAQKQNLHTKQNLHK